MVKKHSLGRRGEDAATAYLKKRRYRVVARNHRQKWGELDIIAIAPNKTLVLVEVKTVTGPNPVVAGEDQMSYAKMRKFKRAAEIYANGDGKLLVQESGWRTDLITVEFNNDEAKVRHYQNI